MRNRLPALLTIVIGVVLIVVSFLPNNLFKVGTDFEQLIDDFRPALQEDAIAQARQDIAGLDAVSQEFPTKVLPALADALQQTPEQVGQFVSSQFPKVAAGMQALPQLVPQFSGLIDSLDSNRALFNSADEIPTKNLPAQTVPWSIFGVGLVAVLLGLYMFISRRTAGWIAVAVGVVLVVAAFVMSLPGKSSDADQLNENLEPIYTQATVDGAAQGLTIVGDMATEMQDTMLPALAQQLNLTQEQVQQFLGQFPATAQALQTFPEALGRFQTLTAIFANNLDNYDTLKPVRFVPIIWLFIACGAALALVGGWAALTKPAVGTAA